VTDPVIVQEHAIVKPVQYKSNGYASNRNKKNACRGRVGHGRPDRQCRKTDVEREDLAHYTKCRAAAVGSLLIKVRAMRNPDRFALR
jgi:hypothetical protein